MIKMMHFVYRISGWGGRATLGRPFGTYRCSSVMCTGRAASLYMKCLKAGTVCTHVPKALHLCFLKGTATQV